jgi:hypothetical protein
MNKLGLKIWKEWKRYNDKNNISLTFILDEYSIDELTGIIINIDKKKEFFYMRFLEEVNGISFYEWLKLKVIERKVMERDNKLKDLGI